MMMLMWLHRCRLIFIFLWLLTVEKVSFYLALWLWLSGYKFYLFVCASTLQARMRVRSIIHLLDFHQSQICQMLNQVGLQSDINYGAMFNGVSAIFILNINL